MIPDPVDDSGGTGDRWEIGSEFHWMGMAPAPFISWPERASWFLLGRHAVAGLMRSFPSDTRRLWVPEYFCHDVAAYWGGFCSIAIYADDPVRPEPGWKTLRPAKDDVVLAVNYFGVRSGNPWKEWHEKHGCILLEDHSHDPVSGWALESCADFAFSSLRKTMPVPDGAILWSPRGHALPQTEDEDFSGSALKLAAMIWKRECLEGRASPEVKPIYREWEHAGEEAFELSRKIYSASRFSREYLAHGVPVQWRKQREANVRRLLGLVCSDVRSLFNSWPSGSTPMAAVFRFESQAVRDLIRKRLEAANIYCPIHWPARPHCVESIRELAATMLTVPADQRYKEEDMDRIASVLLSGR